MKLGCCGGLDQVDAIKAAGFEYLEVGVQNVLKGEMSDAEWDKVRPDPAKIALPMLAANALVPGHLPIVGSKRDLAKLTSYMQNVAKRAKLVGITRLVFGSGAARQCPPEMGLAAAMDQIVEFTKIAGEACAPHGILLVIEHLTQKETNTVNKLSQERELIVRVAHPHVQALVDSYHYGVEHETDVALLSLQGMLEHVHVAEPIERVNPGAHGADASKAYDFVHFFRLLRRVGYDGLISFEGRWAKPLPEAGPVCVQYLKDCWAKAGKN